MYRGGIANISVRRMRLELPGSLEDAVKEDMKLVGVRGEDRSERLAVATLDGKIVFCQHYWQESHH